MIKQIKKWSILLVGFSWMINPMSVLGQRDVSESINMVYMGLHYGANFPGGDYAKRYGFTNSIGTHIGYKIESNWIFGIDANFLFGNKIKIEGLMQNLTDSNGQIINSSGGPAGIGLFNRGFNVNGSISKLIPVWGPNPNSGILVQFGAGYLWHKLRIENMDDEVPQLRKEYKKGYDRLAIGVNLHQFIGYNFMANRGIVNFYVGFYAMQGFTRDQRDLYWDHPNELVDKKLRIDHLFGVRAGWIVPIYKRKIKDYYIN